LIKALQELERSASQDAEVRERIANLPAEVQDASGLEKIQGNLGKTSCHIQIMSVQAVKNPSGIKKLLPVF
jgi:regulator of Ty1 transposition protein 103